MKRREFITLLGGAAAWPLVARAQPSGTRRIGVLRSADENDQAVQVLMTAFREALRKLGWIEGRNLRIELRYAGFDRESIRTYAAELVSLAPEVVFASPHSAVEAMHLQTKTTPIVAVGSGDLVSAGFAQSHARPGGNVTGFMQFEATINTKYLQLLKDVAPDVNRVAIMQTEGSVWRNDLAVIEAVAQTLGIKPISAIVRNADDIKRAIIAFARESNGGLILPPDTATLRHRDLIVALAAEHRLPAIYNNRFYVTSGGLMSYAGDGPETYRQAAGYVDRILRGAKPADLPVQAPTKFELVINTKAARALNIEVPLPLLIRADELIE